MEQPCPLLKPNGCVWCGRTLKGRQSRWCSRACARAFTLNHRWTQAKAAAKAPTVWYLCANASIATYASKSDDFVAYGPPNCEVFTQKVEVNHKQPCKGKHGTWGCHHHADNLEVLCRPCHLKVTAEQRAAGLL